MIKQNYAMVADFDYANIIKLSTAFALTYRQILNTLLLTNNNRGEAYEIWGCCFSNLRSW